MKNIFKTIVAFGVIGLITSGLGASSAHAQATGNVTLTVTLVDVLAMSINSGTATLNFANVDAYHNGVSDTKTGQLVITSNRAYDLKVKGADLVNGANTIPITNIIVAVDGTTGMGTTTQLNLATTDQTLAANAPATILKSVGLKYSTAPGNSAFMKTAGSYTSTLIYTLTAL